MVETADRGLDHDKAAVISPSSVAEAKTAIHEARSRLAARLTDTADRLHAIFADPAVAQAEPRADGAIGVAVTTIAAAGRTTRAWHESRRTGLVRRAGVSLVIAVVAFVVAARRSADTSA